MRFIDLNKNVRSYKLFQSLPEAFYTEAQNCRNYVCIHVKKQRPLICFFTESLFLIIRVQKKQQKTRHKQKSKE